MNRNYQKLCYKLVEWGQFEPVQGLFTFHSDIQTKTNVDFIFRIACMNGHLEIAQWLFTIHPTLDHGSAFHLACLTEQLHVVQWLYTLTPPPIELLANCFMRVQSQSGETELAKWLLNIEGVKEKVDLLRVEQKNIEGLEIIGEFEFDGNYEELCDELKLLWKEEHPAEMEEDVEEEYVDQENEVEEEYEEANMYPRIYPNYLWVK